MQRGLELEEPKVLDEEFREYEITNCKHDSSYFIGKYMRVESEHGPVGVMLDTGKEELIEVMENEQLTIGRYPRIYGKTTALAGFALHKALFEEKTVMYNSFNMARRIDFLKQVSYSFRNLPDWMQKPHVEGPEKFVIGNGNIFPINMDTFRLVGYHFDYLIFDEMGRGSSTLQDFVDIVKASNARLAVVGTFKPDAPIVGKIWSDARKRETRNGWASLPSFNEAWKVETILSLSNPMFSNEY